MSLNNSEFDQVRQDLDADEPLDGRDSQPASGSSDAPDALDSEDPLRSTDRILEENDKDPLQLNPETLLPEPVDEERAIDDTELDDVAEEENPGLDEQRLANLDDRRDTPDEL